MVKNDWYKIFDCAILPLSNLPSNERGMFSDLAGYMNEYNILTNKNTDAPLTIDEIQKITGYSNNLEFNGILNNLIHKKIIGVFTFPFCNYKVYAMNPYICLRRDCTLNEILEYFSNSSWALLHDEYVERFDVEDLEGGDLND